MFHDRDLTEEITGPQLGDDLFLRLPQSPNDFNASGNNEEECRTDAPLPEDDRPG
jgi:hypothetical protein